jgi:hypothetical protein
VAGNLLMMTFHDAGEREDVTPESGHRDKEQKHIQ